MKRTTKTLSLLILAAGILASCGGKGENNKSSTEQTVESTINSEEVIDQERPDKSDLKFVSSLDKYKKSDWSGAKWIWADRSVGNSYVVLRKTFSLGEAPAKAIASISSDTEYYLWVNDTMVVYDGCLKRGASYVDSFYDEVDLTSYLKKGDNTIVALVCYLGRSSNSNVDSGKAGFLFELDAGANKVISDASWKVKRLKEWANKSLLKDDWPNYQQASYLGDWNVYFDARNATNGYEKSSYDDSSWDNATVEGDPGYLPWGDLYKTNVPLFKFKKTITDCLDTNNLIGKKTTEPTTLEFDIGENRQYSPYFELESDNEGARISYYSDTRETDLGKSFNFQDDYITVAGKQSFESYPWRTGSKIIIEAPAGITFTKVGFRESGFDMERSGKFVSECKELDQIWKEGQNTLDICMRDNYMDCPDRERSPYSGDTANQAAFVNYALSNSATLLSQKTYRFLAGWVKASDNGTWTSRWPSNTTTEIPIQNLAFVSSAKDYYDYTGDLETLEIVYPIAVDYLKAWNMQNDGMVEYRKGTFQWVDWGSNPDPTVLQNEFYYGACKNVKEMAAYLNKTEDNAFLDERMNSIKSNFDKCFWVDGHGYTSKEDVYDERAQAMAVLYGLASQDKYPVLKDVMVNTYSASTYMERYILEGLCEMGEFDEAKTRMLNRYKPMYEDEWTTLWENWTLQGSVNHGWTGAPILAMSKHIAGIKPTAPGYSKYELTPHNTLGNLETVTDTVKGEIKMKLETVSGTTTITVDTIDADGKINISSTYGSTVVVIEGQSDQVANTTSMKTYSLKSGHYVFEVK